MLLIGEDRLPEGFLPPPDTRDAATRAADLQAANRELTGAAFGVQYLRDNFNNREEALSEAYSRRIAAIREATGVELAHPLGALPVDAGGREDTIAARRAGLEQFTAAMAELQLKHPDKAGDIRADIPIERDAEGVTRGAVTRLDAARARATAEGLGQFDQFMNETVGSMGAMFRDPAQLATLGIGGIGISAAKTVGGRIVSRILTEAAINGGAELAVQASAETWRKQAGVPLGWSGMWKQAGLAAAFGGGLGGLFQGGSEVVKALGRATPETTAALARVTEGSATPADVQLLAEAVGAPVTNTDLKALSRAIEDDAADAAVLAGEAAEPRMVADVVRAIEQGDPLPRPETILPPGNFEFLDPGTLAVDARRFQFKEGGDAAGVTDRLKGITEWRPERSGTVVVFEDDAGQRFIADGHQRAGLARRIQEQGGQTVELPGYVYRAADGYTPDDVNRIAALKNIGEGTGTAIDAAKVLRGGRFDLKETGLPPNSALVRDAYGLSRLSDDAFAMAINEVVDPKIAAVVGRLAEDKALHAQMLQVLKDADAKSIGEAESMVRDLLAEPVFVERQESLFGEADVARMLLKEKAQVRGAALRALRKDRAVFNRLIEEKNRIAEEGNLLDTAANTERAVQDAILIEAIDRLSRRVGPVATALDDAARAVAGGTGAPAASRVFVDNIRQEIGRAGGNLGRIGAGRLEEGRPPLASPRGYAGQALVDPSIAGTRALEPGTREAADSARATLAEVLEVDTRGGGVRFHGSPMPIVGLDEGHYESLNYYGQGFYTTDARDISHGYQARKGSKVGVTYQVTEKKPVKAFNMEDPVPEWLAKHDDDPLVEVALSEDPKSVRELYDEMRALSRGEGYSADSIQEIFDIFANDFREHGYNALDHIGGLRTKKTPHAVRIYLNPETDVEIGKALEPGTREAADSASAALADAGGVVEPQVREAAGGAPQARQAAAGETEPTAAGLQVLAAPERAVVDIWDKIADAVDEHRQTLNDLEDEIGGPSSETKDSIFELFQHTDNLMKGKGSNGLTVEQTAARLEELRGELEGELSPSAMALMVKYVADSDRVDGLYDALYKLDPTQRPKPGNPDPKPPVFRAPRDFDDPFFSAEDAEFKVVAGGLFDDGARAQLDLMDALPAGTGADGKPRLTTHGELASQAERVDLLADTIEACKG